MPVHLGCALQQVGKGIPAERERGGKADRRPQRIAPAERLAERQDTGFVDPPFHCAVGAGGQRDEATDRDRKRVVEGKGVYVSGDIGGSRTNKKKKTKINI